MAKFCSNCGNEVNENAVVCLKCGCAIPHMATIPIPQPYSVVDEISKRIRINATIWLVIAVLQILIGIAINALVLLVGILNLVSSIQDVNYIQVFSKNPAGIVPKVKPLASPIITLIYNLLIGGGIGVVGSIYWFVGIRGYVLENEQALLEMGTTP